MLALALAVTAATTLRAHGSSGPSGSGSSGQSSGPGSSTAAKDTKAHVDAVLAELLDGGSDFSRLRVIVTVKPGAKKGLIKALKAHGATINQDYTIIEAFAADLPVGLLRALLRHPAVVTISTDAAVEGSGITTPVTGTATNSTYSLRATLGIQNTTLTGTGIGVAVVDSGIYPASDFGQKAERIVAFRDFTLGGIATAAQDPHGHGTHVAGIIAGDKSEALGVATKVNLVGLRVLDANGTGATSNVIAAVQWAVYNKAKYRIGVINLSLGHPIYEPAASDPLVQAVEAAVRAGVVVVTSAGNFGKNPDTNEVGFAGITSPGNAPSSITVGAVNTFNTTRRTDDVITDYSSRGPTWLDAFVKPDIVAPGHKLLSVASPSSNLYLSYPNLRGPSVGNRKYMYLSGASMASGVEAAAWR